MKTERSMSRTLFVGPGRDRVVISHSVLISVILIVNVMFFARLTGFASVGGIARKEKTSCFY